MMKLREIVKKFEKFERVNGAEIEEIRRRLKKQGESVNKRAGKVNMGRRMTRKGW